jgi:transcription antitermination factor NusG
VIWYALKVMRQREFLAEQILTAEGFTIFVPIEHNLRYAHRRSKRRLLLARPAFPGHIFVGINPGENMGRLDDFRFVQGFVSVDGKGPTRFTHKDMHQICTMFHQRPIPFTRTSKAKRSRGQGETAEIVTGPYAERRVRIVRAQGKIEALYELFRQKEAA